MFTQESRTCHPEVARSGEHARTLSIVRVIIIAESFLPRVNGVSGSVIRASRHLLSQGHDVEIIAPSPSPQETPDGVRVHSVRSFTVPGMGIDVGYALASTIRDISVSYTHLTLPTMDHV